jgi:tetratricopeptide (TPR) repeat protein
MTRARICGVAAGALVVSLSACWKPAQQAPSPAETVTANRAPADAPEPTTSEPELSRPAAEVTRSTIAVKFPAIPKFEVQAGTAGTPTVDELRLLAPKWLDKNVTVSGYVTWIYDCVTARLTPGTTRAQVRKRIDDDPTLCERAKFYLGTSRDSWPEDSLWVVDVPRHPNKLEKARLPKDQLKAWPAVPKFKVGDHVTVTGKFAVASPHAESHLPGLIVFGSIAPAKATTSTSLITAPAPGSVAPAPMNQPKRIPPADSAHGNDSMRAANEASLAFGQKQYENATSRYRKAVELWPGNHSAWYGLGASYMRKNDWPKAVDAFAHAVELVPDEAMYWMYLGIARYRVGIFRAREQAAQKQNVRIEDAVFDPSTRDHDDARAAFERATALNPELWRARYYVGLILRDGGFSRAAAEAFTAAGSQAPSDPAPYLALADLYRTWGYLDEAIAVAEQALRVVPGRFEQGELSYSLGIGALAKHDPKRATVAFEAIEKNHQAPYCGFAAACLPLVPFQLGRASYMLNDRPKAKRLLEEFVRATSVSPRYETQLANQMLLELAAAKR